MGVKIRGTYAKLDKINIKSLLPNVFKLPSKEYLFIGTKEEIIYKIDPDNMNIVDDYSGHPSNVTKVLFDNNGNLFSGSRDETVHKVNPEDMSFINSYNAGNDINNNNDQIIRGLEFGNNGFLYVGTTELIIKVDPKNMESYEKSDPNETNLGFVNNIRYSRNKNIYATGSGNEVRKFNKDLKSIKSISDVGPIEFDNDENVYVNDLNNNLEYIKLDPRTLNEKDRYVPNNITNTGIISSVYADGNLYIGYGKNKVDKVNTDDMSLVERYSFEYSNREISDIILDSNKNLYIAGNNKNETNRTIIEKVDSSNMSKLNEIKLTDDIAGKGVMTMNIPPGYFINLWRN